MSKRLVMVKQHPLNMFLFIMELYYQLTKSEVDRAVEAMPDKTRVMKDGSVIQFMRHFISHHYYHITLHVTEQLLWVVDEQELAIVIAALKRASRTHHIQVLVWNIMSNHVHLIIRTTPKSDVSKFMQSFLGGAIQKINGKRLAEALQADPKLQVEPPRVHFEGRFNATWILDTTYLQASIVYVLTNAEKAGIPDHLGNLSRHNWAEFRKTFVEDTHMAPGNITFAEAMGEIEQVYFACRYYWIQTRGVHPVQQILPSRRRRRMQQQIEQALNEVNRDLEYTIPARIRKRRRYDPDWERW